MRYKNRIELRGNLGADPVERTLPSGTRVVTFSMATRQRWKNSATGEWQERTDWHYVEAWGKIGEEAMLYVKGNSVDVEGQARTDRIVDKNTGEIRYFSKVNATSIVEVVRRTRMKAGVDPGATDVDGLSDIDPDHVAWLAEYDNAGLVKPRHVASQV